jgi:hypothetical protein
MPYVNPIIRRSLKFAVGRMTAALAHFDRGRLPGVLNYVISTILAKQIKDRGCNYHLLNELIGALECCKLELYRRLAAPYEDKKIGENGDVFS